MNKGDGLAGLIYQRSSQIVVVDVEESSAVPRGNEAQAAAVTNICRHMDVFGSGRVQQASGMVADVNGIVGR